MTTKCYLGQLRNIDRRINDKIEEAEKWRAIAFGTGISMSEDKVQTTPNHDRMGEAITLALDCEKESRELAKNLVLLKHTITKQIDGIEDALYYNILKSYYLKGKKFTDIASMEDYSYKQIKRFYEEAVKEFEKMYGSEYIDLKSCP